MSLALVIVIVKNRILLLKDDKNTNLHRFFTLDQGNANFNKHFLFLEMRRKYQITLNEISPVFSDLKIPTFIGHTRNVDEFNFESVIQISLSEVRKLKDLLFEDMSSTVVGSLISSIKYFERLQRLEEDNLVRPQKPTRLRFDVTIEKLENLLVKSLLYKEFDRTRLLKKSNSPNGELDSSLNVGSKLLKEILRLSMVSMPSFPESYNINFVLEWQEIVRFNALIYKNIDLLDIRIELSTPVEGISLVGFVLEHGDLWERAARIKLDDYDFGPSVNVDSFVNFISSFIYYLRIASHFNRDPKSFKF
jgi:hypothetical protein